MWRQYSEVTARASNGHDQEQALGALAPSLRCGRGAFRVFLHDVGAGASGEVARFLRHAGGVRCYNAADARQATRPDWAARRGASAPRTKEFAGATLLVRPWSGFPSPRARRPALRPCGMRPRSASAAVAPYPCPALHPDRFHRHRPIRPARQARRRLRC